jgi:predicted transglutaminase-like cysteine proteinase
LRDGAPAPPPAGFTGLCMTNPEICSWPARNTQVVALNDETQAVLEQVNLSVNGSVEYESDPVTSAAAGQWHLPVSGRGDCKSYALAKQQALIARGFPQNALRIAIVRTLQRELHAVLTVDTDSGDLVLDNMTPEIRSPQQTAYAWLLRQSSTDAHAWVRLTN